MNISKIRKLSFLFVMLCVSGISMHVCAASPSAVAAPPAADDSDKHSDAFDDDDKEDLRDHKRFFRHGRHESDRVTIGHDSYLRADEHTDSVVAVLGSAISEGDAESVVAVAGNVKVTGPVHDSAVAVLGSVYVDSPIDRDVVAVFGNVELGPHA